MIWGTHLHISNVVFGLVITSHMWTSSSSSTSMASSTILNFYFRPIRGLKIGDTQKHRQTHRHIDTHFKILFFAFSESAGQKQPTTLTKPNKSDDTTNTSLPFFEARKVSSITWWPHKLGGLLLPPAEDYSQKTDPILRTDRRWKSVKVIHGWVQLYEEGG